MKSARQKFIEATQVATLDVHLVEDGDQVRHKVYLICPGCGARYYRETAPPHCLLPRCEFPFNKEAARTPEQDLTHTRHQAVSRYVLV